MRDRFDVQGTLAACILSMSRIPLCRPALLCTLLDKQWCSTEFIFFIGFRRSGGLPSTCILHSLGLSLGKLCCKTTGCCGAGCSESTVGGFFFFRRRRRGPERSALVLFLSRRGFAVGEMQASAKFDCGAFVARAIFCVSAAAATVGAEEVSAGGAVAVSPCREGRISVPGREGTMSGLDLSVHCTVLY